MKIKISLINRVQRVWKRYRCHGFSSTLRSPTGRFRNDDWFYFNFSFSFFLSSIFFFFFFRSQYQSRSVTLPTREGGWLTALVQKSRERCAHFRHSDLLHHRCYLIENCPRRVSGRVTPTRVSVSDEPFCFFFSFFFPLDNEYIYIYIETIYSLDKMQVSFERIPQHTGAIGLKETEVGRERTPSVIIANGGNSIGESLSIGCFLTTTLSTPTPQLLVFQTTGMGSSTTKILRSGVSRFRVSANLWNEKRKKKRYFEE